MTMKREVRDRWVSALRSDEYPQGQGLLCDENGKFCCLGVFNEVMGNEYRVERDGARAYFGAVAQGWSAVCNKGWLEEQGLRGGRYSDTR